MSLFHVNPETLKTGVCKASKAACPFGDANHYTSEAAAKAAVESTATSDPSISKKRGSREVVESVTASPQIGFEDKEWLESQNSWTKNERGVLDLLEQTSGHVPEDKRQHLMSKITGLHFAKGSLSAKESRMLIMLEKIQKEWLAK